MRIIDRFKKTKDSTEISILIGDSITYDCRRYNINDVLDKILASEFITREQIELEKILKRIILMCPVCQNEKIILVEHIHIYPKYLCSNCGKYFEDTLSSVRKPK